MKSIKSILITILAGLLIVVSVPYAMGEESILDEDKIIEIVEGEINEGENGEGLDDEIIEEITNDLDIEPLDEFIEDEPVELVGLQLDAEKAGSHKPELLAGVGFSIARLSDGSWWSWGANNYGQLGLGDGTNRQYPTKMNGPLDSIIVKEIQVIENMVYVLADNGDLYHWGKATRGGVSHNTPTVIARNIQSIGFSWVSMNPNPHDSLAMVRGGEVFVHGSGYAGQFGRGISGYGSAEYNNSSYAHSVGDALNFPAMVSSKVVNYPGSIYQRVESGTTLKNVKLAARTHGGQSINVVDSSNRVWAWGAGYSSRPTHLSNVAIGNIKDMQVSANHDYYAIVENGDMWTWRGHGAPKKLYTRITKMDITQKNTFMLIDEGILYAKGDNTYGIGHEGEGTRNIASNVVTMAAGDNHVLWMTKDGKVWGMGWNAYRQLASERDGAKSTFTKVPTLSGIDSIHTTDMSSFAIKGPSVYSWGHQAGQFGGTRNVPAITKTFNSPIKRYTGMRESQYKLITIVLENGEHYTIGDNWRNRLGYFSGAYNTYQKMGYDPNIGAFVPNTVGGKTYVKKTDPSLTSTPKLIDSIQGYQGGIGLDSTGQLVAWGWSSMWGHSSLDKFDWGGEGIGDKSHKGYIRVPAPAGVRFKKVDGGLSGKVALSTDGKVYSWAVNTEHVLGRDGDPMVLKEVPGLPEIVDISISYRTTLAIDKNGDIWAWGQNSNGQVGDGSVDDVSRAKNISEHIEAKFVSVDAGTATSFAITDKGELYAWGNNRYGQLGLGDSFNRTGPRKVDGLPGKVKEANSALDHAMILLENGDVYVAGSNSYGQLGLGKPDDTIGKTEIPFPDYVTIDNNENVEYGRGDTIKVDGSITSVVDGNPLTLTYEVVGSEGVVESGTIGTYSSLRKPIRFTKNIMVSDKYRPGGYTITVSVLNGTTKFKSTDAVNFRMVDKIPPSTPQISSDSDWTNTSQTITITPGIDAIDKNPKTFWIDHLGKESEYTKPFIWNVDGAHTLKTYTIDSAGNKSAMASTVVKIDKATPGITLSYDKGVSHEDLVVNYTITSGPSGIKKLSVLGYGDLPLEKSGSFKIKSNGAYEMQVTSGAGNSAKQAFEIKNIDKTLSIKLPPSTITSSGVIGNGWQGLPIGKIEIADWRETPVAWRMNVKASQLVSGKNKLYPDSLRLGKNAIDTLLGYDLPMSAKRGVYTAELGDLEVLLNESVKLGTYTTDIVWTIIQAP